MKKNTTLLIFFALSISYWLNAQSPAQVFQAPAGDTYTMFFPEGKAVIPNGRIVAPVGNSHIVAPHPYGLVISQDGNMAVTANSGVNPISITILKNLTSGNPEVMQIPPSPAGDKGVLESVFMGLALSPDTKTVYVAGGQANKIYLFNTENGEASGSIDCSHIDSSFDYTHGYLGDMTISSDGQYLFVADQIGFRLVVVDTKTRKVVANCPTGRYPFGVTLSADGKTVYVANVGMYKYGYILRKKDGQWKRGSSFTPPFEYNTPESEQGIANDSIMVPGLGPVNSDEAFSLWAIDITKPKEPKVKARIKTGRLIGEMVDGIPAVGGASPNSIAVAGDYVFISNGSNDNVTVLNALSNEVVTHVPLNPVPGLSRLRGIIPFGITASPDGKYVYVAESGINAIAVIEVASLSVLGHIPTGWFPARVKVTGDGKRLVIANAKGFGSGPNGGSTFKMGPEGSYIGSLMKGTVQITNIPDKTTLKEMTNQVIQNNFLISDTNDKRFATRRNNPVPLFPGASASPIKYIVFVSKENRTYDEVFGQVEQGKGEAALARYGSGVTFSNENKSTTVSGATVMPNHLKLAREFAISDNFYVDSDVSADGHRWLANTYPNEWVEATTPANYGGNRDYREKSNAPGNLGMNGAAGAIYPEDYNEGGSMWDHMARHQIGYYNFGFGVMFEPADYQNHYKYGGIRHLANYPMPASLKSLTSYRYPTYNMAIPDQFRIDVFKEEFMEKWGQGKDSMPSVLTIILPNDHGAEERPQAGFPYRESYMADNDLALGRLVEFLSHTPYWKNMLIVVTEDDAQNGVDHVDAHRSLLLAMSPYIKRNYVSHTHTSFGSIFKTFWNILGVPYLNQYDAAANDFADMFTSEPDFTPYSAVPVDARIFDPQKALDPFDEKFDWEELKKGPEMDNMPDMIRESKERDAWRTEGQK